MHNNRSQVALTVSESPIHPLDCLEGWKDVQIQECGEELVRLSDIFPERIIVDSQYFKAGYSSAMKESYARETLARLLCEASELLPLGWKIVIFDAWRPVELQQQLYYSYIEELKLQSDGLKGSALRRAAQKFVSLPSANPACPSPHVTGGAVDLTLQAR